MRWSIGTKLIGLVTALLLISEAVIISFSSELFLQDNSALVQQVNAQAASNLASQLRIFLETYADRLKVIGETWVRDQAHKPGRKDHHESLAIELFRAEPELVMAHLFQNDLKGPANSISKFIADDSLKEGQWNETEQLNQVLSLVSESPSDRSPSEKPRQFILTRMGQSPALIFVLPLNYGYYLTAWMEMTRIAQTLRNPDVANSFLVDRVGRILLRSDDKSPELTDKVTLAGPLRELWDNRVSNGQTAYFDSARNQRMISAYHRVGVGDLSVLTEIPEAKAFASVDRLRYRAELLAIVVLCLSLIVGYHFSESISLPVRELVDAAERISVGDYQIQLKPRTRDELADLAKAFNAMASGLEERNQMKETFTRYHTKELAEKMMTNTAKLGGERKEVSVLFMDIRDFTPLTESMEPEKVVEMLNEYLTRMVALIRTYGGVVDKYIGDAIMALWGVPEESPDDASHAVRCCLEIREELARFNALRAARGEVPLRVGMGLNRGKVIAGNIGSPKKMEYTVIGDTVNVASRLESATKDYGTDLLISRAVYEKVYRRFIIEPCPNARVKGKTQEVEIFRVRGYYGENGRPILVPEIPPNSPAKIKFAS